MMAAIATGLAFTRTWPPGCSAGTWMYMSRWMRIFGLGHSALIRHSGFGFRHSRGSSR